MGQVLFFKTNIIKIRVKALLYIAETDLRFQARGAKDKRQKKIKKI